MEVALPEQALVEVLEALEVVHEAWAAEDVVLLPVGVDEGPMPTRLATMP